jgi:hypothetical protein
VILRLALLGCVLGVASPAVADLATVRSCVERNTPRISAVQELELSVRDAEQREGLRARFKLFWRRMQDGERRILVRFEAPEELGGAAFLVTAPPGGGRPKVHLYLPEQGRPRAIMSRGELAGFLGRLSLGVEELELLLDPIAGSRLSQLADAEVGGRPVFVVERREDGDSDARFPRVVSFIDREFCIPLRAELYDEQNTTRKVLDVDVASITRIVETWLPRVLVFHDLSENSDTVIRLLEVEIDSPFSPALLTVEALSQAAN